MSDIGLNPEQIASMRSEVEENLPPVHRSLQNIEPCDGGVASSLIGFLSSAAFEASRYSADTFHALMVVSTEVVKDFSANEEAIIESFEGFTNEYGFDQ